MFFLGGSGEFPSAPSSFCPWLHRGTVLLLVLAFANQVRYSVLSYLEKEVRVTYISSSKLIFYKKRLFEKVVTVTSRSRHQVIRFPDVTICPNLEVKKDSETMSL